MVKQTWRVNVACLTIAVLLAMLPSARAELNPSQVMILVNKDTPISSQIAQMYQKLRGVPATNVLTLSLGTAREISMANYRSQVAEPVKKYLQAHPAIRCIVTTSGVPYTLAAPRDDGAALDNEVAAVLRDAPSSRRMQTNPLFLQRTIGAAVSDPRKFNMVYVARLDGPDLKTITRMAQDTAAVEKTGLQGPAYGDARGIDSITGYGLGDFSIRAAIDRLAGAGFHAKLDLKEATWTQPRAGTGNQAAGAAFYVGWHKVREFQDIFGQQGLARGAIAWHVASGEAVNLWDAGEKGWCMNLLRRGAAVTLGPVREPYVTAFPHGDIFVEALLRGATLAESYWLALPNVSWNMVLLGDPLYRPLALKPRPSLVARAYIASGATRILEQRKTGALLVQVECVGPAGSSTPAFPVTAEAGIGLVAATGSLTIPPLKAGQSTVIRVPNVTAGTDPTGLFRLHLNVQSSGEKSRRIVLEGRTGFSRITGGVLPKSQLIVSPDGEQVITGVPGNEAVINTESLRLQPISFRSGWALAGAEFAPDGQHAVLLFADPQRKAGEFVLTDRRLANPQPLPAGLKFVRWWSKDRMLLQSPSGLISHSISGAPDRNYEVPEGWSGTVFPGTDTQMLTAQPGKVGVKKGAEPLREVLQGVKGMRSVAVADDLLLMGAVDWQGRLWVQHGLDAAAEVIDSGVAQVVWGPISRRGVVKQADGRSRVYDGRDRSWLDLGAISAAQWSPDEERLLMVQLEKDSNGQGRAVLSLLVGKEIRKLCSLDRIGEVQRVAFSADGQRAFLLAPIAANYDVWMMSLTPHTMVEPLGSQRPATPPPEKRQIIVQ
ncbi:MAG: TIGR03790 family protein [Acidobacteria bacterium]|nr:TIGR03790 family protein [Acidobacteriota bacterium]